VPELSRFYGIIIRMYVAAGDWALLQSGQPPVKIDPLR
jgi:hypothetical protein